MEVKAHTRLVEGMQFVGTGWSGKAVVMDAAVESGGRESGARPLELLLVGLTGCTGMDVASLLRKMRVPFTGIELNVSADKSEEHPHVFTAIRLEYVIRGRGLDPAPIEKAISLSLERYCSVSAMLRKACPLEHSVRIEEDPA
jgi:putative redox protein